MRTERQVTSAIWGPSFESVQVALAHISVALLLSREPDERQTSAAGPVVASDATMVTVITEKLRNQSLEDVKVETVPALQVHTNL